MPTYRHPLSDADEPGHPPARVHISRAVKAAVDDAGHFEAPRTVGEAVAERFDMSEAELRVDDAGEDESAAEPEGSDTCEVVKNDGEVCGRELPCPYHGDGESDE